MIVERFGRILMIILKILVQSLIKLKQTDIKGSIRISFSENKLEMNEELDEMRNIKAILFIVSFGIQPYMYDNIVLSDWE
jgi:hypothetical protein